MSETTVVEPVAIAETPPRGPDGKFLRAEDRAAAPDPTPAEEAAPVVFTNVRFPEETICVTAWDETRRAYRPTGELIQFHSTKYVAPDAAHAAMVRRACPWAYEEPAGFLDKAPDDETFFRDAKTGFKTLNQRAFVAWMNNPDRR